MANSFLSSLETLNTASVTNISSLFFYTSDNDTSKLVSGAVLQGILGHPPPSVIVRTSNFAVTAGNSVALVWEQAISDPWGMWDAASNTLIVPGFTGMVQFRWRTETNGTGTNPAKYGMRKNGSTFIGHGWTNHGDVYTGFRHHVVTAPVSCSPTDYFDVGVQYPGNGSVLGAGGNCWVECQPLQVYI